jgi:hypothetical protein
LGMRYLLATINSRNGEMKVSLFPPFPAELGSLCLIQLVHIVAD